MGKRCKREYLLVWKALGSESMVNLKVGSKWFEYEQKCIYDVFNLFI